MSNNSMPAIRINGFDEEWELKPLSELCSFHQGLTYHPSDVVKENGVLVLRSSNIQESVLCFDDNVYVSPTKTTKYKAQKDDILMCVRNGSSKLVGKCATINDYASGMAWGAFMTIIRPFDKTNSFVFHYLNSPFFRKQISGGSETGMINQITFGTLNSIFINVPKINEMNAISNLLDMVNERIAVQSSIVKKLKKLHRNSAISVLDMIGDHNVVCLSDVLTERKEKNINSDKTICSVAVEDGVVDQIQHLGRSFAAKNVSNYKVVCPGDLVYTKSPTGSFPYGIFKQSFIKDKVAVSPLYAIYYASDTDVAFYLHHYFLSEVNTNNYLHPLVEKGAKNTMNISNERAVAGYVRFPNERNLKKVCNFLRIIDERVSHEQELLDKLIEQKQILLSGMFC